MAKNPPTSSTTQLSIATGIPASRVELILREAGIEPASITPSKRGAFTLWPRAESLTALRASEDFATRTARNSGAGNRARIIEIQDALIDGTRTRQSDLTAALERLETAGLQAIADTAPRYAQQFANINAANLPDPEREEKIRATFQPVLDQIEKLKESSWEA